MAVPMLCGLVPKAPFSAVVTSSYSVAKGRGPENQFKQYYVQMFEITPLHALASGSVYTHLMTRGSIVKA